jgi:hypothetical protein
LIIFIKTTRTREKDDWNLFDELKAIVDNGKKRCL